MNTGDITSNGSRPLKVLFVSDHLGHTNGRIHGATRYFLDVLPRLQKSPEVQLHVVFLRGYHEMAEKLEEQGITPLFLGRHKHDPRSIADLIRLIRKHEIQFVHCAGMKGILTGRLAARYNRIPCLIHLHDMIPQSPPIRWLMLCTRKWTTRTIVISDAVARFAVDHFKMALDTIVVLRNGINLAPFRMSPSHIRQAELRQQLGVPQNAPILMTVGRLHTVKGQQDAIEVLRRTQDLSVWLVLVGEGPEKHALREYAKGLPVVFAGQRTDIPDLLALATLLLMPSNSEGLGLSAMEALAAGTPVVAYATGGLVEIIEHNHCGMLVPTGEIDTLAAATRQLLTDPHQRESFSRHARQHAQAFSLDQHVANLLQIYRETAGDTP